MNTDKFLVSQDATLRSALTLIENNNHGIILTFDCNNGKRKKTLPPRRLRPDF